MSAHHIPASGGGGDLTVRKNSGADVGERPRINLIEGSNITLTVTDDAGADEIDITIAAPVAGSGAPTNATYVTLTTDATLTDERTLAGESGVVSITDGGAGLAVTVGLATGGVALAKLADIASDRLIGRDTAGAGVPEALTVGGGVEFTGSGGIQRSALTGDVTAAAGSGATTIANDAVTLAKMADIATDRLIGRDTALTGDPEAITVGGGLEFTGSGGIQRSALTGDVTAAAGSNALDIAAGVVTDVEVAAANKDGLAAVASMRTLGTGAQTACAGNDARLSDSRAPNGSAGGDLSGTYPNPAVAQASAAFALTGTLSPAQLTADQNDYAPTGHATVSTFRIDTDASRTITGLAGGAAGRVIVVHNIGANPLVLADDSASSAAANRFALSGALTLTTDQSAAFRYDGTSSRWRAISQYPGGGGSSYTDEEAQDAVGTILTDTATIDFTYTDAGPTIEASVKTASITLAMQADLATDRLIGRDTAGTGVPEALTVGGGIEFTGSGGIQRSALTGDVTASAGSGATIIANDAVTYAKLQNVSATDRLLGRDTAAAGDVEELTVGGGVEFTGSGGIQRSALTGDVTAAAGSGATTVVAASGAFALTGDISPAQITADQNDYAPTGHATASTFRLDTDASRNITGLAGGADGRLVIIRNVGAFNVVLVDASVSSTAANRFAFPSDITLAPEEGVLLQYDATLSRWTGVRQVPGAGGGGAPTDATYVTLTTNGTLTSERTLAGESGVVSITDGGAGSTVTVGLTAAGVPLSKLANIATDRLLGRDTAASGAVEELTVGGGVEFTTSGGIQRSALTGDVTASAGSGATLVKKASEDFAFTGDISPAQLTADQNDYNPANLATSVTLRLSTDASRTITGLAGGADGRVIIIENVGSNNLVLADESASSTAANRFALNAAITLGADQVAVLKYDATSSRWRALAAPGAGGSGAPTDAQYVVVAANGTLTDERVATAGRHITITDAGAGGAATFDFRYDHTYVEEWDEFQNPQATSGQIGKLGWGKSGSDSSFPISSVANHQGIFELRTGNVSGNNTRIFLGPTASSAAMVVTELDRFVWIVRPGQITNIIARVGLGSDLSVSANWGAEGVYFELDPASDASWRFITRSASTSTVLDTTVDVTAGNWYVLEARRDSGTGDWTAYVNGTSRGTNSTNKPTGALAYGASCETSTAANRHIDLDYNSWRSVSLGTRYT